MLYDTIGCGYAGIRKPDSRNANAILRALGPVTVETIPVPHDRSNGFLGAYWRRPAANVDWGKWRVKYGDLVKRAELDIGYRLIYAPVLQEPRRGAPQETGPRRTTL